MCWHMAQGNDEMRDIFGRFEQEVRAKMLSKNTALQQLGATITGLNTQIVAQRAENEASAECARAENALVLEQRGHEIVHLRKKMKQYRAQRDAGVEKVEQSVAALAAQEKELSDSKKTTSILRKNMDKTERSVTVLSESIEAHVIKIGMVEVEMESVRMRNKVMRDENSKLKEKISRAASDSEQQHRETAAFKPQMLDMVDTMVVEYRKIMQQIALLDDKQKRILLEKSAIIEHMQQADSHKKRKTQDDTAEASARSVAP